MEWVSMLQSLSDLETQRVTDLQEHLQQYVHDCLRRVDLQFSLERQRQRNHFDEELHKLRQQLTDVVRDQQQQQQKTFATFNETVEELRKEISAALQHLSRDMDRASQVTEAHMDRALERLRKEMLEALLERDKTTVKNHLLGELFITLGKQLQGAQGIPRKLVIDGH